MTRAFVSLCILSVVSLRSLACSWRNNPSAAACVALEVVVFELHQAPLLRHLVFETRPHPTFLVLHKANLLTDGRSWQCRLQAFHTIVL